MLISRSLKKVSYTDKSSTPFDFNSVCRKSNMVAHSGGALLKGRHTVWVNVLAPRWYYPERRTSNA